MTITLRRLMPALCVFMVPAWAGAQDAPGMSGRANDASNQVGSGGVNSAVAPSFFNTSNLYVTGNVSRGGYFRGNSPIRDVNSLFLPLPSAHIGDFQRDAINLSAAVNNPTPWAATPYYNPYRTVTGLGAIQAGQNLPGSNMPSTTFLVPQPYDAASPGMNPVNLSTGTRPLSNVVPNSSIYTPENSPALRGGDLYDRLRQTDQTQRLQGSPVFGGAPEFATRPLTPEQPAGLQLPADPYALDQSASGGLPTGPLVRQSRTAPLTPQRSSVNPLSTTAPDLLTPSVLAPKLFNAPPAATPQRDMLTGRPVPAPDADAGGIQPKTGTQPIGPGSLTPDPLGNQLTASQPQTGIALPTNSLLGTPDQTGGETPAISMNATSSNPLLNLNQAVNFLGELEENPQLRESVNATPTLREQHAQAMSIIRDTSDESVSTLAGKGNSRLEELMREAEAKSRAGDYYQASTVYALAAAMDPSNPLVRLGYAHSLAAAGEYVTAVLNLEQAIDSYGAFGFLRLDLNEFVRDPEDLDLRRADLEQRLEKKEDYRLRFLLGYLEYYSGFAKFGRPNLHKAAENAPAGSTIARFPDILKSPEKYLPAQTDVPSLEKQSE